MATATRPLTWNEKYMLSVMLRDGGNKNLLEVMPSWHGVTGARVHGHRGPGIARYHDFTKLPQSSLDKFLALGMIEQAIFPRTPHTITGAPEPSTYYRATQAARDLVTAWEAADRP